MSLVWRIGSNSFGEMQEEEDVKILIEDSLSLAMRIRML